MLVSLLIHFDRQTQLNITNRKYRYQYTHLFFYRERRAAVNTVSWDRHREGWLPYTADTNWRGLCRSNSRRGRGRAISAPLFHVRLDWQKLLTQQHQYNNMYRHSYRTDRSQLLNSMTSLTPTCTVNIKRKFTWHKDSNALCTLAEWEKTRMWANAQRDGHLAEYR